MITAASVPSWVIAVNAEPGSAAEELADDRLVGAGGDRQELRQPLHDAQHQCLKPTHQVSSFRLSPPEHPEHR